MPHRPGDPGESGPTLPVETLRHWYVTVCGGRSPELGFEQIGINREALEKNTSLDPAADRVRVTVLGGVRRPVLMDRFFEVVPLDAHQPDAFSRSPDGEAVFPEGDDVLRPHDSPRPGQEVLLNPLVGMRLNTLPASDEFARILQEVLREDHRGGRENV